MPSLYGSFSQWQHGLKMAIERPTGEQHAHGAANSLWRSRCNGP
jgi:hypothetical protein